jgi:5'-deoxynucleotidase YfbR-like HD superfamily hydrolase
MTEVVQRLPENSIGPATSPNATETNNHIPDKLIAVGEKIFGEDVITQLLTRINSILEEATNLDDRYKLDLKNRIYRMILQFLEVLASCLENGESTESYLESKVMPTIKQAFVAVANLMHLPEPYKNLGAKFNGNRLVEVVRDFFNLTGCSDINDQTLLIAWYLLNQVKRWRVTTEDYAKSLLKINFEETDLMHVIKMMILAKFLCLEFELDQENLTILAKLIILHDLPEIVIGDFSQGENYGDKEIFEKIRDLFKQIEAIVPEILLGSLGSQEPWQGLLALYQGYENRLKPKARKYAELDRVYRILRILDKLDSLITVMAMVVLDINDSNDLNQYYKQGYSNYLIATIQNFLLTMEQYAQLLQSMPRFSGADALRTHLTNLIRKIFEFLNQQYNTQSARTDKDNPDPQRNSIIIIDWFDLVLNLISNQLPITGKIITEVIQELNPKDPFDEVISWFGG